MSRNIQNSYNSTLRPNNSILKERKGLKLIVLQIRYVQSSFTIDLSPAFKGPPAAPRSLPEPSSPRWSLVLLTAGAVLSPIHKVPVGEQQNHNNDMRGTPAQRVLKRGETLGDRPSKQCSCASSPVPSPGRENPTKCLSQISQRLWLGFVFLHFPWFSKL
jgi:hypothetical protein